MSTRALKSSDPLAPVRYLDVALVVLAAPFVLLTGLPALGYAVGAALWIAQRVLEAYLDRRARAADVRAAVGLRFASMIARTWIIGLGILAVGLGAEREDGFTAAVVCLVAYTVHLATALILRPLERNAHRT
ncbi:MAG TPA: hypothetical protein VN213_14230 [Solirubrobacteraceae bacterium]|nr:hypothetical protein [Solirubrobacteraceae bacterium]